MKKEDLCPCKSGMAYGECCGPIISGEKKAETAEALMRARYSAYAVGEVGFLKTSAVAEIQEQFDEEESNRWSKEATWHGLEIVKTEKGGPGDTEGVVEFRALYTANGQFCNHHERSVFRKEREGWLFVDGEMLPEMPVVRESPKVGRNDPCPCGSGRKYKKCCGKES